MELPETIAGLDPRDVRGNRPVTAALLEIDGVTKL